MYHYNFWHDKKFIGSLCLGSDSVAIDVANGCGATSFENEITNQAFEKCSACGAWLETSKLHDGLCGWCGYLERLKDFINHCETQLDKNWDNREELYKEDFTITYRGKTLVLEFGAIEYNALVDCLKNILEENQD